MTKQEIFNTVIRHLVKQGKQAMGSDGASCVYLASDGNRCAVGILLNDNELALIGNLMSSVVSHIADVISNPIIHNNLEFLTDLQKIHDNKDNWDETGFIGLEHAMEIAHYYKLKIEIDELKEKEDAGAYSQV